MAPLILTVLISGAVASPALAQPLPRGANRPLLEITLPEGTRQYRDFSRLGYLVESRHQRRAPDLPALIIRHRFESESVILDLIRLDQFYERPLTELELEDAPTTPVTTLLLAPGQAGVSVKALAEHDLPVLSFRLVPRLSEEFSPLEVYSEVSSILIEGIEETQDSFVLTVHNTHQVGVAALISNLFNATIAAPDRILIPAGGRGTHRVSKRATEFANQRAGMAPYVVELRTAVFDDFTFEGDRVQAAQVVATRRGFQLRFRRQVSALERLLLIEAPAADLLTEAERLFAEFPAAPPADEVAVLLELIGDSNRATVQAVRTGLSLGWKQAERIATTELFFRARDRLEKTGSELPFDRLIAPQLGSWRRWLDYLEQRLGPPADSSGDQTPGR